MEQNHVYFETHHSGLTALSAEALNIAKEIDSCLPAWAKTCWRWRILFNRILLDDYRYRGEKINDCKKTLAAMHEIIEIFHCLTTYKGINHYHERVRPPCPEY
ncbi:hypothetical protein SDC9_119399 [bioreactor metagenome]|uniref:Uncharacterized protein n=1 Tax=bioreactor metagenome TaxID=1076179 RepID=A0A645C8P2_9ZZZZ